MNAGKASLDIRMNTDLEEFGKLLSEARTARKMPRDMASCRLGGMLYRLYDGRVEKKFVPRQIHTVGELYSFTEDEMLSGFSGYGKKTWLKLNDLLMDSCLPSLKLPQEYTSGR